MFKLHSNFKPTGDQPKAIERLVTGLKNGKKRQVLMGVTGSGKTFTMANVIKEINKPTLVLAHNKTLAGQLYAEFKEFFPENHVEYFVSYYDYYQPEAYVAKTDTYIEKDASINDEIDELRHSATSSLINYKDTIVIASVSCIYGIGEIEEYKKHMLTLSINETVDREQVIQKLIEMLYERSQLDLKRGTFRVRGDVIEIIPSNQHNKGIRIDFFGDEIERISEFDTLTGKTLVNKKSVSIFPASHFVTNDETLKQAVSNIREELDERLEYFKQNNKLIEHQRLKERVNYDLEMLEETGFCRGVENYSRHLALKSPGARPTSLIDFFNKDFLLIVDESHVTLPQVRGMYNGDQMRKQSLVDYGFRLPSAGRKKGETPTTLMDFFPDDYLLVVDESHVTLPQVRGMFNGDRARKQLLVDYGFRLPSALDNRPLKFDEFETLLDDVLYVSATPGDYELGIVNNEVTEQIIRPTGLLDPKIDVRSTKNQIDNLMEEINKQISKGERTIITTLTIRMAEELTNYLKKLDIKVAYLHNEIKTLERMRIVRDLRLGKYDVLVGINLLREGLDIPEVSLIAIMDADKQGFLRSTRSLIQTIGRAARNENGRVIMYADNMSDSMNEAIKETERRRSIQEKYNEEHNIVPKTIIKEIRELISNTVEKEEQKEKLSPKEKEKLMITIENEMKECAKNLDFERAMELREILFELKSE